MTHPRPPKTPAPPDDTRGARDLSPVENADLCTGCVKCCTYITIEIDAPRAAWEYDQWLWTLHHEGIGLYVERPERWYLHVETRCNALQANGRCGVYARRPVLCREYDPRTCERRNPLSDIVAWFHTPDEFETWIRTRRPAHWARLERHRSDRSTEPAVAAPEAGFVPVMQLAGSLAPARRRR